MFAPSQWKTALPCNNVSHLLGASLVSALKLVPSYNRPGILVCSDIMESKSYERSVTSRRRERTRSAIYFTGFVIIACAPQLTNATIKYSWVSRYAIRVKAGSWTQFGYCFFYQQIMKKPLRDQMLGIKCIHILPMFTRLTKYLVAKNIWCLGYGYIYIHI